MKTFQFLLTGKSSSALFLSMLLFVQCNAPDGDGIDDAWVSTSWSSSSEFFVDPPEPGVNLQILPKAPSGLRSRDRGTTALTLEWRDRSTDEKGFYLERKESLSDQWARIMTRVNAIGMDPTTTGSIKSYRDDGLEPGTMYWYRIFAYNDFGTRGMGIITCTALPSGEYHEIDRAALLVTTGEVNQKDGYLEIEHPKVRGTEKTDPHYSARLQFRFNGKTSEEEPLKSGQIPEQFGFKLRAKNSCNVLYVMWRFRESTQNGPEQVVVSHKRNPGLSHNWSWWIFNGCSTRGYTVYRKAEQSEEDYGFPTALDRKIHLLEADLFYVEGLGYPIVVHADDLMVASTVIPTDSLMGLNGPVGIRSDNAVLDFNLWSARKDL